MSEPTSESAAGSELASELAAQRFEQVAVTVADVAAGRPVVLHDVDRDEGDLVFAAAAATPHLVAFMVRHTSGFVAVALTGPACDRLALPSMCGVDQDPRRAAHTVTVDASVGVSTGISAADRSRTIRLLADRRTTVADLSLPGHVAPLRAQPGGVLHRRDRVEAAVDLARLAGLEPAGVLCGIVSTTDPDGMARGAELAAFAEEHGLQVVTIADLVAYRRRIESLVVRAADARIPTAHGAFRAIGYDCSVDRAEHLALVVGDVAAAREDVPVAVRSECLAGDVLGSLGCGCGSRLDTALAAVAAAGRGVVLYVRRSGYRGDGEGIGLLEGLRRRDAAHEDDPTDPDIVAQILTDLGVRSLRLLGDDPATVAELTARGLQVGAPRSLPEETDADDQVRLPAAAPALRPVAAG